MNTVSGGLCAAKGFKAAGMHCGLKGSGKKDLALIASDIPCSAAATYTTNIVQAAPLHVTRRHLSKGKISGIVVNSGNANACAPEGEENALAMCAYAARELHVPTEQVAVASTGVIGQSMTPKMETVKRGIFQIYLQLDPSGSGDAAEAIMTTDMTKKELAVSFELGGKTVSLGGIAKGSGMIHPNMGTMLCFLTTDAAISGVMLQRALSEAVAKSFNRVSVDGDTSTNDMCLLLANGWAGNPEITEDGADYQAFKEALTALCVQFARMIAADGEGATHLLTCTVEQAPSEAVAECIAKSVISSSLMKAAVFGGDANWGRVLCAMGYSGAEFDPGKVAVSFCSEAGEVAVCRAGRGLEFDEELAARVLSPHEVVVRIQLDSGSEACTCWGCDLTYDYVKINGDYRT